MDSTQKPQKSSHPEEPIVVARKTKRPPGNWAASSSRENSSNGGFKFRQNFLPKSYEPKNGGVKGIFVNKYLSFQQLTKDVNKAFACIKMRQITCFPSVS